MGSEKGLSKFFKSKEFTLLVILVVMIALYTFLCALVGKSSFRWTP
jgi:hypothetical protein